MNNTQIIEKAYRLTNKNSTTFLDGNSANVLAELNVCYGQRVLDILKVRQDLNHDVLEATTTLYDVNVGNAGNPLIEGDIGFNGEYPFDAQSMRPLRIEISYDGVTWTKAKIYDLNENSQSEHDKTTIQDTFSQDNPYVRMERNSYFVRPLNTTGSNIVAGIHAWWENRQNALDGVLYLFPDFEQNLHDILSYDMANLEKIMHPDKYDQLWRADFDSQYAKVLARFEDFYKNRMKRNFVFKTVRENYK